ncbi:hypothetical protein ABIE45_005628 [Methylobacterium sp. OAE515]|uniref:hypothetical protein n=1 Tax=Methylobacterium sp. OAE515 TaxID=2817895 RepID=UPI001788FCFE
MKLPRSRSADGRSLRARLNLCSWQLWQSGGVHTREIHKTPIADLDHPIATRKQHAAERPRAVAADAHLGTHRIGSSFVRQPEKQSNTIRRSSTAIILRAPA